MSWAWASPVDGAPLRLDGDRLVSADARQRFSRCDGVWQLLAPDRVAEVQEWASAYGAIRSSEGRRSHDDAYYRSLPWTDTTGRFAEQWAVRAASFERLLAMLDEGAPGRVVDAGAGNAWASARLAERGWDCLAIDVNTDADDGLGARTRHGTAMTAAMAEIEAIPLADESADVVLINAALHYAKDPGGALIEAARVVRPGGRVFAIDSPVFENHLAGEQMVREQHEALAAEHGTPPPMAGKGFVTSDDLLRLGDRARMRWENLADRRSRLRSFVGRRRAGREIAQFSFIVGRKEGP